MIIETNNKIIVTIVTFFLLLRFCYNLIIFVIITFTSITIGAAAVIIKRWVKKKHYNKQ